MRKVFTFILSLAAILAGPHSPAQTRTLSSGVTVDGVVEFDKTVHDWGDVLTGDGPLSCTFTVKNISSRSIAIFNVAKSCGCTEVEWTREEIAPGEKGTITATYSNDEGPYPFSKNLTVYISDLKKPVILRMRGTARSKPVPIAQMYPVHWGDLGLKEASIAAGNMNQGSQRSDVIPLANLGKKSLKVSFKNLSPGLEITPAVIEIPAGGKAEVAYTVTSSRERWGKNYYSATVVYGGKARGEISLWAFTKEDFSSWTKEQLDKASQPSFDSSTANVGIVKAGTTVPVSFSFTNKGKSSLHIYKADSDSPGLCIDPIEDTPSRGKGLISGTLDTSGMEKGEFLIILTLTTNTPLRPMVNLFVAGAIE